MSGVGDFTAAGPPLLQEAIKIARTDPKIRFRSSEFRTKLPMLRVKAQVRYVGEVRSLFAVALAALVISACGAYREGPGAGPSPTPSEGTGLGYDLVVTERDKTATMRVGQKVEVVLHAASNMDNWTQVRSTNEAVLIPIVNPAATAVRGVTLAAFKAVAPGHAEITAYASPHCPPGSACPMYVQVVSIKVTVTP
ncbi:MAG TPA: hypothetical protein VFH00_06465 [Candidatus Nitrosotalea sp.]|nr:hypothetical protein [Candidatus Nitrosotalea sp.]